MSVRAEDEGAAVDGYDGVMQAEHDLQYRGYFSPLNVQ